MSDDAEATRHEKQIAVVGQALNEMTLRLHQQDHRITELLQRVAALEVLVKPPA